MQLVLKADGWNVETATNGRVAVEKIQLTPPILVVTDLQMPEMNGIITSKKIKAMNLSQQPKIIMVTAYGREELIHQAEEIHLDGILFKPINRSLLYDATIQAFGREDGQSRAARLKKDISVETLREIRWSKILLAEDNEINQSLEGSQYGQTNR